MSVKDGTEYRVVWNQPRMFGVGRQRRVSLRQTAEGATSLLEWARTQDRGARVERRTVGPWESA